MSGPLKYAYLSEVFPDFVDTQGQCSSSNCFNPGEVQFISDKKNTSKSNEKEFFSGKKEDDPCPLYTEETPLIGVPLLEPKRTFGQKVKRFFKRLFCCCRK